MFKPVLPWLGYSADGLVCKGDVVKKLWECKTLKAGKTHNAATICQHVWCMDNGK